MTVELERRLRMYERRLAALEGRRAHIVRNAPILEENPVAGAAPTDAQYVVMALSGSLSAERRLQVGTGLSMVDGGANGDVTLNATGATIAPISPGTGLIRGAGWWLPYQGNLSTDGTFGLYRELSYGTRSTPNLASTDIGTSVRRWRNRSGTGGAIFSDCAQEHGWATTGDDGKNMWLGNSAGVGGFFLAFLHVSIVANSDSVVLIGPFGDTSVVGLNPPAAALNTFQNTWGIGADTGDTNLQAFTVDNTGGVGHITKTDLGIAKSGIGSRVYDIFLYAAPNASQVQYRLIRRDAAGDVSGSISATMPSSTVFMGVHIGVSYQGAGTPPAAAGYDIRAVWNEWNVGQGVETYGYF